jgi:hypothetical protein
MPWPVGRGDDVIHGLFVRSSIRPVRRRLGGWVAGLPRRQALTTWRNPMGKTGRKRRGRKKKAANHGKRPNA